MTLERGALLYNRYRIIEILGQGGMGSIYRAVDDNLGVEVAVKENLFTTEEYARQFRREAIILASLKNPNLPRVSDHFVIDGQGQYLVMDYIEGEDLRERMDRVPFIGEEEAIVIGVAICDAMSYMHSQRPPVLHRDIKPGNVRIAPNGHIFLVDFGLAKIVEGTQVTTTGARAMTPGYSSPEQYGTARTDQRSDVYSLGATLYAALTNTIPEDGLARAMEQADLTPIRKRNPKVSRRVASAVEKALAVHPEDRYQNVLEFKAALLQSSSATRQIQHSEELTIVPPPPEVVAKVKAGKHKDSPGVQEPSISGSSSTRRRRMRWRRFRRTMLGLLSIIVMAGFIWTGMGMPGREKLNGVVPAPWLEWAFQYTPTPTVATPTFTSFPTDTSTPTYTVTPSPTLTPTNTNTPTPTMTPTITPTPTPIRVPGVPTPTEQPTDYLEPFEDEQIAFASMRSGSTQIWLYSFSDGTFEQLTDLPYGACQPAWSPDGRLLAFISPCNKNVRIYEDAFIFVLDMENREIIQLAVEEGSFDPAWSPDGTSMLFTRAESTAKSAIYRINTKDSSIDLMLKGQRLAFNPAWSPDGDRFVFASTNAGYYFIYIMENDPEASAELFARTLDRIYVKPTWSVHNQIVFSEGPLDSFLSMWRMPASMLGATDFIYKEEQVNPAGRFPELDPDFNSSGHWIAYESWPTGDNRDIYIIRDDGEVVVRITTHARDDFDPAWRPYPRP